MSLLSTGVAKWHDDDDDLIAIKNIDNIFTMTERSSPGFGVCITASLSLRGPGNGLD